MRFNFLPSRRPAFALRAAALALTCLAASSAAAQQDLHEDDWSFNLFNDFGIALQAFQIQEMNGAMSHNWLYETMMPGQGLTMEFTDPLDTRCEIVTRVVFQNGATLDGVVNYCGTAIVRVTNSGMYYE